MLSPFLTWLVAAIVAGHNFSRKQLAGMVLMGVLFYAYLVPLAQYGRNFRDENGSVLENMASAYMLIKDLGTTRSIYLAAENDPTSNYADRPHYFNQSHGFFDRLTMLQPDDALIEYTDEGNYDGPLPTYSAFINIIPHFLWKDKPFFYFGNTYAHEIGMIAEDNDATSISFSPSADVYHQLGWGGVFGILPPVLFLLFMVVDGLSGDIRRSPFGLLFVVVIAHVAPEGGIGGQVYVATYAALAVVLTSSVAKYLLPYLVGLMTGAHAAMPASPREFKPVLRPHTPSPGERRPSKVVRKKPACNLAPG